MTDEVWIFGYGSLIWRVDFPFTDRQAACIKGFSRRFWQGSTDHRGVPGKPGRVVTLIESPGDICWGHAYRIDPAKADRVLTALDYREKGGYQRLSIEAHFEDGSRTAALTWLATRDNPNYLGEAPVAEIARQVLDSRGPSGHNVEYVQRLHQSLQAMNRVDPHVLEVFEALTPGDR